MELVVGASQATMGSVLSKLGGLLSNEYTLIRGVEGDLQYINDELATMQSFLRAYKGSHEELMKDWMKQIRDITYDIEDCIDESGKRIRGVRTTMSCYCLASGVYEILTWWPRRDIATKLSILKVRAQQISERRGRYGVVNPAESSTSTSTSAAKFDVADNQAPSLLQLVTTREPVGVEKHTRVLEKRVTCIVGFGGVGKTAIATALYRNSEEKFGHRAMVTVSQSTDLEAILTIIRDQLKQHTSIHNQVEASSRSWKAAICCRSGESEQAREIDILKNDIVECLKVKGNRDQLKPHTSIHEQLDNSEKKNSVVAAAVKGVRVHVSPGLSTVMAALCCGSDKSEQAREIGQLKENKMEQSKGNSIDQLEPQLEPHTSIHKQHSEKKNSLVAAAFKGVGVHVSRGSSTVMAALCCTSDKSEKPREINQLKENKEEHSKGNSYLLLIDDVWSASLLDSIINALPNDEKSKIIVTTRFHDVATTQREVDIRLVDRLAEEESKKLFMQAYNESKGSKVVITQPQEESSNETTSETEGLPKQVWEICKGMPLAIITMAGLVACNPGKGHQYWEKVCEDIFPESEKTGAKNLTQEQVARIVSHCYNDMPAEIQTCSLYLSIFPKGYRISRKRLTRRWIAEGIVCEKDGLGVDVIAETYFKHLIRRKIIQPVEHNGNGKVKKCVVHDMVLELIVRKASEENFITVVGGNWFMQLPSSKVRRLSIQDSDSRHARDTGKLNLSHVRSVTIFGSLKKQLSSHSFGIVQVLDLEGCKDFKQHDMTKICKMLLLKYLSLRKTNTKQLPDNIGKLKNLETLDIRETEVAELPKAVCQLEWLVNILGGDKKTRMALKLPGELKKKMKALQILSGIEIVDGSSELRHLIKLRKLAIYKLDTTLSDASLEVLRSSIEYLGGCSLETLIIDDESSNFVKSLDGLSSPPRFLVALELSGKMTKLPKWITQLNLLKKLTLSLTAFRKDNLMDLSKLEALFCLTFCFRSKQQDREILGILAKNKMYSDGQITVPDGGFKSLKLLCLSGSILPLLRFSRNAMPELERLEIQYSMLEGVLGTENLVKLKEFHLTSSDEEEEHRTTKEIVSELRELKRIDGTAPRVIVHQRPSVVKPKSG